VKRFIATSLIGAFVIIGTYFLPYGTWASLRGLPLHPLIVHSVVVLLPLIAVVMIALIFNRRWLGRLHYAVLVALALITLAVIAASSSGQSLAAAVGLPEEHAEWGNTLVFVAMALYGAFSIYLFFAVYRPSKQLSGLLGGFAGVVAIASLALTFLVGHSGAESVWKSKYQSSKVPIALSQDVFTLEEVTKHSSADDCWTIVQGSVYDLTTFINRHPGGAREVVKICGKDGSDYFLEEHSGQKEPETWLETLLIGKVKK
jgi:cytochrome b involved in lipid metabolism